jgi:hypothetical protein
MGKTGKVLYWAALGLCVGVLVAATPLANYVGPSMRTMAMANVLRLTAPFLGIIVGIIIGLRTKT